ncbi:uncharacterized protein LOC103971275 [Musa acuminata AAA Group]|uniref:(wild Malaysian banana) hypothetical protein n=1 Tax=Musa acuminata subsp. malaccensis TaxID=214687 RepID=A0A804L6F5_MUSAM|nr:PREDICTED: uncharacterized protein LOC103971275 [Musa acuminata subsp. malaccensis]CAG1864141.1 unnamed protein product [Musa acuminata subsp. malaccensis]
MLDQEGQGGPPHGVLLAVVVGVVVAAPFLVGGGGEAITGAISDMLSPAGLLLLPVLLVLVIRFLSSDRGAILSDIFAAGSPDSIHRVGGSPVGVALLLLLILFLLYYRFSIFGGDDDTDD